MVSTAPELAVGQVLDSRYRIVGRIARGGMATVYEALDTRLHREVAVKVMHAALAGDDEFVQRFIREARSAARLSHPNVVAVFDQGSQVDERTGEDCVYLVMELVRGRTLRQVLRQRGALPPADALAVLEPVLAALRAAHDAGIVHRDVKPENVLLADDGRVEVADFGLARAVDAVGGHTATRGVLLGTVSYLAPEQVVDGSADARTDVYSAGIMLFEMLTGTKPHEGDSPLEVAYKHVNDDVARPSALRPGIPPAVDRLVRRATDRRPGERFADGREFLAAVRATRDLLRQHPDQAPGQPAPSPQSPDRGAIDTRAAGARPAGARSVGARPAGARAMSSVATGSLPRGSLPTGAVPREAVAREKGPAANRPAAAARGQVSGNTTVIGMPGVPIRAHDTATDLDAGGLRRAATGAVALRDAGTRAPDRDALPQSTSDQSAPDRAAPTRPTMADVAAARRRTLARRRRRRGIGAVVAVVVLALVVAAAAWYIGDGRFAAVPRLSGLPVIQAQQATTAAGLELKISNQRWDDTIPAGYVISASDPAQTRLPRGATIGVVVSRGAQRHILTTLIGLQRATAEAVIRKLSLKVGTVQAIWDSSDPPGQVVDSDPEGGQNKGLKGGTPVNLTVSRGPEPVTVPSVLGQPGAQAAATVRAVGAGVKLVYAPSDTVPSGLVVSQTPGAGDVNPDAVVTLVVSTGAPPVRLPWTLIGTSATSATSALTALGLHVVIEHSLLYVGLNRVISIVGKLPGTSVPRGSTVVLTVI